MVVIPVILDRLISQGSFPYIGGQPFSCRNIAYWEYLNVHNEVASVAFGPPSFTQWPTFQKLMDDALMIGQE